MKLVFLGTGEFAVPTLEAAHEAGHEISLVVSQPDRPKGRGLALQKTAVKAAAERLGLPVFQPEKLRLAPDPVIALKADALVVVAYGQILREDVLDCAPLGAINVHASLLPRYRGAAPIQWAIANGETRTGVTTMRLDRGTDTGPILLQEECEIAPDDTTPTLEPRLALLGARLLLRTLDELARGTLLPRAQDDALATRAPLIAKALGIVDFTQAGPEIANRLRGFSPWPGLHFFHQGRSIKILAARSLAAADPAKSQPGTILAISREGIEVACAPGSTLRLERVQPESRSVVAAFEFANGARLAAGDILGDGAFPLEPSRPTMGKD